MKKKMLAAILMGTMVFGLTACGNESGSDETTNKEAVEETTEKPSSEKEEESSDAPKGEISVISREEKNVSSNFNGNYGIWFNSMWK